MSGWTYGTVDKAFVAALRASTAPERVFWADEGGDATNEEITSHSIDRSFHTPVTPDVVVYPLTVDEVQNVVKACGHRRVPLTPRGSGTGLEGGSVPCSGGVVLDMCRMKSMEILKDDLHARVGPGLLKSELNKALAPHGLIFGPDPASDPCFGGMASTGSSGLSTLLCGTFKENVVSLLVVTPDGKAIRTRQRVRKSSTGYDVTQWFLGAEGTLGVIVEIIVRIRPLPVVRSGAVVGFSDIRSAANAVVALTVSTCGVLARCELLNADCIRATNKIYDVQLEPVPTLFLEFHTDSQDTASRVASIAKDTVDKHSARDWRYAPSAEALDSVWEARRGCYFACVKYYDEPGWKVYIGDVCVPLSRLAECLSETEADFRDSGFPPLVCAHVADGNFHAMMLYKPEMKHKMKDAEGRMIARAVGMGGTVSGEHGVGVGKMKHIEHEHGQDKLDLMRGMKRMLDPNNFMNPGKIFTLDSTPRL